METEEKTRDLEAKLESEIETWKQKLTEESIQDLEGNQEFINNIKAYYNDSQHFREERMLIESFEALVWAWAWLEIGKKYNFVR